MGTRTPDTPLAAVARLWRANLNAAGLVRLCGALAVLALTDAPDYRTQSSTGHSFNTPLGVCGALAALVWLLYHVGGIRRRAPRWPADLQAQRRASFRSWRTLVLCASIFVALWLLRSPIRLSALFAIATILVGVGLLLRLGVLSLALLARDRARPLSALRWLALVPCSLVGLPVGLQIAGDSWPTLLGACVAACLGPMLARCPGDSTPGSWPGQARTERRGDGFSERR